MPSSQQQQSNKRRRLSYEKCVFCRRDKKKCDPPNRQWPGQKCGRCEKMGLECSGNSRTTKNPLLTPTKESTPNTRTSEKSSEEPADPRNEANSESSATEDWWSMLRNLSLQSSWINHIERVCATVEQTEAVYAARLGVAGNDPDLSDIKLLIQQERESIRDAAKNALRSPSTSPTVKYGIASMLKTFTLRSYERSPKSTGPDFPMRYEDSSAFVDDLEAAGDIGFAISVQEGHLNTLGTSTPDDIWRIELERYGDLYQQFRSAYKANATENSRLPCMSEQCLPLLDTTSARDAAIRLLSYCSARDIFGRNLLHIALYNRCISVIDDLILRMPEQDLNARDFFGRTPLHIAATFGFDNIVGCLLKAGVDISPEETSGALTPLQCAAAAGNEETILRFFHASGPEESAHNRQFTKGTNSLYSEFQAACTLASSNGHRGIVEKLLSLSKNDDRPTLRAVAASAIPKPAANDVGPIDTGSGYDFIAELTKMGNWN